MCVASRPSFSRLPEFLVDGADEVQELSNIDAQVCGERWFGLSEQIQVAL